MNHHPASLRPARETIAPPEPYQDTARWHARNEAESINTTIASGGTVEWRRSAIDNWLQIEAAVAIGADVYFAFRNGCEVVCRAAPDRGSRGYSLQWCARVLSGEEV